MPVWSLEEGFRLECKFGSYWNIHVIENHEITKE